MKLLILFLGSGLLTPLQRQLRQRGCLSMLLAEEAMGVYYCSTYYKAVRVGGGG